MLDEFIQLLTLIGDLESVNRFLLDWQSNADTEVPQAN